MITTDFLPGSPCWVDLGAPDPQAASDFYRAVLGWRTRSAGPDAGGYAFFTSEDRTVAALGPLTEEGARSAWTVHFCVPDAEAAAAAVEKAGGAVRVAPMDVMGLGVLAHFTDPQGGRFAVWQSQDFAGFDAADTPGALDWVELWTTDSAGARAFYDAVFGWSFQDTELPGGGGTYTLLTPAGAGEERMHGGMMQMAAADLALTQGDADWHPVFRTEDCAAAAAAVAPAGGRVLMGPEDAPGVGRLAVCTDPAGADFVLLQPRPE
ncbi:VOC family protein [Nocardiopsis halophila]|uniref:VOC family protein n=1 Tax=Nocardiopsis halophila TaxID=141692 RepID=UPI00034A723C|nr:VOC family protein [Nocardiopsis halophila]